MTQSLKIIFAFFYDFLLLFAVLFVASLPYLAWFGPGFQQDASKLLSYQLYLLAIIYAYLTYFWTHNGQSPGLRVWHLRLVDQQGYCLTRNQANIRFILGILLFPLGWITLFLPNKKQTLQDLLAKTQIISTK